MANTISFTLSAPLALVHVDYLQSSRFVRFRSRYLGRESIIRWENGGIGRPATASLAGGNSRQGYDLLRCLQSRWRATNCASTFSGWPAGIFGIIAPVGRRLCRLKGPAGGYPGSLRADNRISRSCRSSRIAAMRPNRLSALLLPLLLCRFATIYAQTAMPVQPPRRNEGQYPTLAQSTSQLTNPTLPEGIGPGSIAMPPGAGPR